MSRGISVEVNRNNSTLIVSEIISICLPKIKKWYTSDIWFNCDSIIKLGYYTSSQIIELLSIQKKQMIYEGTLWGTCSDRISHIPHTYDQFLNSLFNIVIICHDFDYLDIYTKESISEIQRLLLRSFNSISIKKITDSNDDRTGF